MNRKDALRQLKLGNSVAEADDDLQDYFVETESYRSLIHGDGDIVAGDKGTGKSALFKILLQRYATTPELARVVVVPAFNTGGDPVFQQLAEGGVLTEGQYRTIWKTYVLSLGGNRLLSHFEGRFTPSMEKLDTLLQHLNLREKDYLPVNVFSRLVRLIRRLMTPKSLGIAISFDEAGLPITTPQVEFGNPDDENTGTRIVRHSESLGLLNKALAEADWFLWLVLDRLDEAFTGYPQTEIPALRAVLEDARNARPVRAKLINQLILYS